MILDSREHITFCEMRENKKNKRWKQYHHWNFSVFISMWQCTEKLLVLVLLAVDVQLVFWLCSWLSSQDFEDCLPFCCKPQWHCDRSRQLQESQLYSLTNSTIDWQSLDDRQSWWSTTKNPRSIQQKPTIENKHMSGEHKPEKETKNEVRVVNGFWFLRLKKPQNCWQVQWREMSMDRQLEHQCMFWILSPGSQEKPN